MTIYQRIQELAKSKNISVRQLEHNLNYSNGTIRKWKTSAPTERLVEVANYLNTTPNYLILGHIDKSEPKQLRSVEITDDDVLMTFEGRPIPEEDKEIIRRLLRGK